MADLEVLKELVSEDDTPENMKELSEAARRFEEKLDDLELRTFLSDNDDARDAILSHSSRSGRHRIHRLGFHASADVYALCRQAWFRNRYNRFSAR